MMEMLKWGVAATLLTLFVTAQASADGDAGRGKTLFTRCSSCHAVTEQNKVGPHLSGVFGRTAGTVAGATYSKADDRVGHDVERTDARCFSDRAEQGSAGHDDVGQVAQSAGPRRCNCLPQDLGITVR
jgi:cytochrome c2